MREKKGVNYLEKHRYRSAAPAGLTTSYHFLEYINDFPTETLITIMVDEASSKIVRLIGWAIMNRGFVTEHIYSEQEAIQAVLDYVADVEGRPSTTRSFDNKVHLTYRTLKDEPTLDPWWFVGLGGMGPYFVNPAGEVESALEMHQ